MYSFLLEPILELRSIACHMGSHSLDTDEPCINPARQASTRFTYPEGMEACGDLGSWLYIAIYHTASSVLSAECW